jgi:light-regulated signal transduction histidine kinase (bacteriophytochrome)
MTVQAPTSAPDLDACAREPIHVPGSIQPHGILLALSGPELSIARASANLEVLLDATLADALGRPLADSLPSLEARLGADLREASSGAGARYVRTLSLKTSDGTQVFDAVVHRSGDLVVLELEVIPPGPYRSFDELYPTLRRFVEHLQNAGSDADLCRLVAADVRRMTGFDRVLVYRFDEGWNGTVLAEDRNDELPSYLDLRFPASDIPAQARELYRRNRLRIIPDAGYAPVPIEPRVGDSLDLSHSILRSVSPVHVEYMHNMGTMASMSISILRDDRLWGLISCHNKNPLRVSLQVRNACDFLAQIFSLQSAARERASEAEDRVRLRSIQARLLSSMAAEERFIDGLIHNPDELLELAAAQGAAVVSGDHCWCLGETPSRDQVTALFEWLWATNREDVFATDALAEVYPEARAFEDRASGLLAISISKIQAGYILWFRPELVRTVKWGGDPTKPVQVTEGQARLHPRRSFETWKETVRGRALPWEPSVVEAVKELRNSVIGIVLKRAEELASLNEELRRSNKELEAFSYSVSHDLRAPFRHIVGYSELLKRNEGEHLSDQGRRFVDTIIESAYTAGTLVDNLLSFSQMGRTALKPRPVDIGALVAEVRERAQAEVGDRVIKWTLGPLDVVEADPIMIRLVIENLLSNAVKYTRPRNPAVIEVGSNREPGEIVFYVRDNGVGFDEAYGNKLFGVFQRLHRIEDFEGTGIGLANVRRIVERHGGRTWAKGAVDKGATFFFSLPDARGAK